MDNAGYAGHQSDLSEEVPEAAANRWESAVREDDAERTILDVFRTARKNRRFWSVSAILVDEGAWNSSGNVATRPGWAPNPRKVIHIL
ncbi:hypothetical protein JS533_003695, partial [Bifidobacterium amazonense]